MTSGDFGPVRVAVVDIVIGDAACVARAVAVIDAAGPGAWNAAIALATAWGVVPTLYERLGGSSLPEAVRGPLRAAAMLVGVRSKFVMQRSAQALAVLAAAGIDTVAIKGVGLIAALARDPADRATSDLDVVVREADAARARATLQADGYVESEPAFDAHMGAIATSRQLHNFARTLARDGFEVDLHWRFGPQPPPALEADRLIRRGIEATIAGLPARVADPLDGVAINVHHALRGSFVASNTVRDLCDLLAWWNDGRIEERLDELCATVLESGLAPSLCALWGAILQRAPQHPLRAGYERLIGALDRSGRADAALLQRYFEETLRFGPPAHFTLELFAPRVYARSIVHALAHASDRDDSGEGHAASHARRKPLTARLADMPARLARVARELARVRAIASYRAVARAQSRFH